MVKKNTMGHQKVKSMQKTLGNTMGEHCPKWGLGQKEQLQNQIKMESLMVKDKMETVNAGSQKKLNLSLQKLQLFPESVEDTIQSLHSLEDLSELHSSLQRCIVSFLTLLQIQMRPRKPSFWFPPVGQDTGGWSKGRVLHLTTSLLKEGKNGETVCK